MAPILTAGADLLRLQHPAFHPYGVGLALRGSSLGFT
jgi:hypothetical protein